MKTANRFHLKKLSFLSRFLMVPSVLLPTSNLLQSPCACKLLMPAILNCFGRMFIRLRGAAQGRV